MGEKLQTKEKKGTETLQDVENIIYKIISPAEWNLTLLHNTRHLYKYKPYKNTMH